MSYRSPWSEAGATVGNVLMQLGSYFGQKQAAQGEQSKQQVQEYVSQAELALADPNYKWQPGQREAAEAFITQAKNITAADPMQAAGMWQDLQQRGIKIPSTTIKQGNADAPMTAEKTLTPYQGGVAGFFGDVNRGVTQAGQQREQYELDLANLRELKQMGQEQAYRVALQQMEQDYGKDMMAGEQAFATQQTQQQLDVAGSASARDGIIAALTGIGNLETPKNQQQVQAIMDSAKAAGLQPWDMVQVQAAREALGSDTAALDWEARVREGTLGDQAVKLGRQQIKLGDQQVQLGEFMLGEQEYIASRRGINDALSDRAAMDEVITSAVANGDDKEINNLLNVLEAGGTIQPEIYEALTNAGITRETLEENYGDALRSDEWMAKRDALDKTEMRMAEDQLFRSADLDELQLATAQVAYGDQIAATMTPKEIEAARKDPRHPIAMFLANGTLGEADIRAMKRNAGVNQIIQQDAVNAPKVERHLGMLESLAAVPADTEAARNSLNATLGQLVELGAISEDQVPGLASMYERGWDYGRRVEDEDLRTAEGSRRYTAVMRAVQEKALFSKAVEGAPVEDLGESWDMYRESYQDDFDTLAQESDALGCGTETMQTAPAAEQEACRNIAMEIRTRREEQRTNNTQFLGLLSPAAADAQVNRLGAEVERNVLADPAFADAPPEHIMHEVERRLFTIHGIGVDPGEYVEPQAAAPTTRQGRPSTGTLAGDVAAAGREVGGTVKQQVGEIGAVAGAGARYVFGRPGAQAAPTPSTVPTTTTPVEIDPNITRDLGYKKLIEGGLTPEQEVAEYESLSSRFGVGVSDLARFVQQQRGTLRAPWGGQ